MATRRLVINKPRSDCVKLIVNFRFTPCFHDRAAWSAAQAPLPLVRVRRAQREEASQAMPETFEEKLRRIVCRRAAVRCGLVASIGAMALAGCAQSSAPEPVHAAQAAIRQGDSPICRPDAALLAPQSVPDCLFRRAELKTIDPDQWARLKIEYERQCYQNAEKTVRERLNRLSAANRCEG